MRGGGLAGGKAAGKAALGCQGDASAHRKHTVRVRAVRQSCPCSAFTFRTSGQGEVSKGTGWGGFRSSGERRGCGESARNGAHASWATGCAGGSCHPTPPSPMTSGAFGNCPLEKYLFSKLTLILCFQIMWKDISFHVLDFFFLNPIPNFKQHLILGCIAHAGCQDGRAPRQEGRNPGCTSTPVTQGRAPGHLAGRGHAPLPGEMWLPGFLSLAVHAMVAPSPGTVETSHVSSSRRMEKQAVVPAHGGILHSLKGKATWVQATTQDLEAWGPYARWAKTVTKGQHFMLPRRSQDSQIHGDGKSDGSLGGGQGVNVQWGWSLRLQR